MHHNHTPSDPAVFTLPGQSVLQLSGPDAVAFAQSQCMNDVSLLADGQWQWNGWLTPQGRVVALFAALRRDAQTLWLLLPDVPAAVLAENWQRYVFRSKVKLTVRDDLKICGRFAAPPVAHGAMAALVEDGASLDLGGDGGAREWLVCAADASSQALDSGENALAWRRMDLRHGLPRLDPAAEPKWTPQQLSLERLKAFSVKKGCYPGQEIVARTHFLGQAKRGLVLIESAAALHNGVAISDGQRDVGSVISTGGNIALAVASLDADVTQAGDAAVVNLPLQDGLAR